MRLHVTEQIQFAKPGEDGSNIFFLLCFSHIRNPLDIKFRERHPSLRNQAYLLPIHANPGATNDAGISGQKETHVPDVFKRKRNPCRGEKKNATN